MAKKKKSLKEEYGDLDPLIIKNMEYAKKHLVLSDPIPGPDYYEDDTYIPEGCRACGGDYPICKRGCPLYDED